MHDGDAGWIEVQGGVFIAKGEIFFKIKFGPVDDISKWLKLESP